jgi:hypothetical protein
VPERQTIGGYFAGQVFLRQGRPLVWQVRFIAYQHQSAAKTLPPESIDSLGSSLAGTYDENRRNHWILYSGSGHALKGRLNLFAPKRGRPLPHMAVPVTHIRNSIDFTAQR